MRNKIHLIMIMVFALISIFGVCSAESYTYGDFEYELDEGQTYAIVTGYNGKSADVEIPADINGYVVLSVGYISDNKYIENITIPDTVETIKNYGIYNCENLKTVSLPASLKEIGTNFLRGCPNVEAIVLDSNNTNYKSVNGILYSYDMTTMVRCPANIEAVTIPESVTSIGNFCFSDCIYLKEITIPSTVKDMGESCFRNCFSLVSVEIPTSISRIPDNAFIFCEKLEDVVLPDTIKSLGTSAFSHCKSLAEISVPDGVTSMGTNCFAYCDSLKSFTIPSGLIILHAQMFRESGLESIVIPENITRINYMAFRDCLSLKQVIIGDGVEIIEQHVFYNTPQLKSVYVPENVNNISVSVFGYTDDGVRDDFILRCHEGSTAQLWAVENGVKWREPLEVSFEVKHNLNLLDLIQIGYWVEASSEVEGEEYEQFGILIWDEESYSKENDFTVESKLAYHSALNDRLGYKMTYGEGVLAQELNTVYYAIPYVITPYGEYFYSTTPDVYSVPTYATEEAFLNSTDSELQTVVCDLLNYATFAQFYFLTKEDPDAVSYLETHINSVLDVKKRVGRFDESMLVDGYDVGKNTDGSLSCTWLYSTANLNEAISINFFAEQNDSFSGMLYWNEEDYNNAASLTSESASKNISVNDRTMYGALTSTGKIPEIYGKDIYSLHYACMYNVSDGKFSYGDIRVDSVAAYLTRAINGTDEDASDENYYFEQMCKRMLVYGNGAKEYAQSRS